MVRDSDAIPVLVIALRQEQVEALNKGLREAGRPVHCSWIPDINALGDAIEETKPDMVVAFLEEIEPALNPIVRIRDRFASRIPIVVASKTVNEEIIARAMEIGAQDVVSLKHRARMQSVIDRELRAYRLERALAEASETASEYQLRLNAAMKNAVDAVAIVLDGIIIDVNPAWTTLFERESNDELLNQPLMDHFERDSHATLKGALVACARGRLEHETISVSALLCNGNALGVDLQLERAVTDGEPCVRLVVAADRSAHSKPENRLTTALNTDPATGLFHRAHFTERLTTTLQTEPRSGVRGLAYIKPDRFGALTREVGPVATESILLRMATVLRESVQPGDLYGRFGGNIFAVLLHRGNDRDVQAWCDNLVQRLGAQNYDADQQSVSLTVTIGLVPPDAMGDDASEVLKSAEDANAKGRQSGGNCVKVQEFDETDTRIQAFDAVWIKRIKHALMQNRFTLLHQPVANLGGEEKTIFDLLVRMLDGDGKAILPREFIPAANRNGLMKAIDRWVIAAALAFCQSKKPDQVFIRLSGDSLTDNTLTQWLVGQIKKHGLRPNQLVFQIQESDVATHVGPAVRLAEELGKLGCLMALEHFGSGRNSCELLKRLPVQYVKIDGSLMQGIAASEELQGKVSKLVEAARAGQALTIAEQVQDANTMAALWQLGVEYMQGFYVQEPEVVLEDDPMAIA